MDASAEHPADHGGHGHPQSFWLWVMCLTGVDYFSTLGYQPSIAFEATGLLTPFATIILVLMTLFGAYPVYSYVAGKSPHGQGSIAMLEKLMRGWAGKLFVLVLLGFAATDFVITKTLSAADAAVHLMENPVWPEALKGDYWQIIATMVLLIVLGATFWRGFKEVMGIAVVLVALYLVLNAIVIGSGLMYLSDHPEAIRNWWEMVHRGEWHFHNPFPSFGHGPLAILGICLLLFPKLALGLSGFETGVAVMPLIRGGKDDNPAEPAGRIGNARKLLLTAALIMSTFLLAASLVTSTLIPPKELESGIDPHGPPPSAETKIEKGKAAGRALAYLAHGSTLSDGEAATKMNRMFGEAFGTLYDASTVLILWFAGASAMAGLLNLVPQYLPRYGMAPEWARAIRPLVALFTLINLYVTWQFQANVEAQGGAYATGVLVLMSSGCVATVIDKWRHREGPWYRRLSWPFFFVTLVFLFTTAANIIEKPEGMKIASWFILAIVGSSVVSRLMRSKELRFHGFLFSNEESRFLWESMQHLEFPVLVPHRPGGHTLAEKEATIRREHRLGPEEPIVFIEVNVDDASNFFQQPVVEVVQEEGSFILRVQKSASVAHTIASLALELSRVGKPPEIHFGWSAENPMTANLGFLLFGVGNVPWIVRELLEKNEPNVAKRPRVIVG
jgi:hypothetical protein